MQEILTPALSKQPGQLGQGELGLTSQETKERLAKVGPNEQAPARRAAGLI
jgi:hypothetical protein